MEMDEVVGLPIFIKPFSSVNFYVMKCFAYLRTKTINHIFLPDSKAVTNLCLVGLLIPLAPLKSLIDDNNQLLQTMARITLLTWSPFLPDSEAVNNLRLMREVGLSSRLLHVMRDPRLPQSTLDTMATVIGLLLEGHPDTQALLK